MRNVEIKYKKWYGWRSVKLLIPSTYSEMSPVQFLASIRLSKEWIDEVTFFIQFFGINKKLLHKLDSYSLYKLAELMDFLRDTRSPYQDFYLKSLPGKLHAPQAKLRGVCFQQFMTADTFFSWYASTDKVEYLDRFVASLYLKDNEAYIPEKGEKALDLEERVKAVSKLPFDLKYSILINWALVKSWLGRSFIHLFPQAEPVANSQGDKVKSNPANWLSIFDQFVGDNIADIQSYKALPCMDAFRLLNKRIKEAKKR